LIVSFSSLEKLEDVKGGHHQTVGEYNDQKKDNKLQKRCTRLAAASDKVYQLLAHGRWVSPGTPASFTAKTGRHDIDEILLKVALKHQKPIIKPIHLK
jgi:hypothetical protein